MKKYIFIVVSVFLLCSCSEYDRNLKKMSKEVKADLENHFFEYNSTIKYIEFNPISYKIRNENFIDSLDLGKTYSKFNYFVKQNELQGEIVSDALKEAKNYKNALGFNNYYTIEKMEKANSEIKLMGDIVDSMNHYNALIDDISKRIKTRKNPKPIYEYTVYVKLKITDDNSKTTENFTDTLIYLFDKDFKIIKR